MQCQCWFLLESASLYADRGSTLSWWQNKCCKQHLFTLPRKTPAAAAATQQLHMFYKLRRSGHPSSSSIGVAVSSDSGDTFSNLGPVLEEAWPLSNAFVFEHGGETWMLPSGRSASLMLYRAQPYPTAWVQHRVLINAPLEAASLLHHTDGRWYVFASNWHEAERRGACHLEVWSADTLEGTWARHPAVKRKQHAAAATLGTRPAGRPIVFGGQLYRFGRDCARPGSDRVGACGCGL